MISPDGDLGDVLIGDAGFLGQSIAGAVVVEAGHGRPALVRNVPAIVIGH